MGAPTSLLAGARAFAQDFPRDQMPKGYLWDVLDYVPTMIDASLTGRGGWIWDSDPIGSGDIETGGVATFLSGDQLLVQTVGARLVRVDQVTGAVADIGTTPRSIQNPVQLQQDFVSFDRDGANVPTLWRAGGPVPAYAGGSRPKVGTVWKSMLVTGGAPGEENNIRFSVPGTDLTTAASYDAAVVYPTSQTVTALAALQSVILVFHPGSVERIRGSKPAHGTDTGDLIVESMLDRQGCSQPRTIAFWNDNCIFADQHGVHMTDGATVRNLASQGGVLYYWRQLHGNMVSMSATTFMDYYIISVRLNAGQPVTLVCDLNSRQWFRFSNIDALTLFASAGSAPMERIWGGMAGTTRLARISACFFPTLETTLIADANGVSVMPSFETPWYRLAQEGRKRVRFVYLSYDARVLDPGPDALYVEYITTPQDKAYTSAGGLPATARYSRYRLPVGKFPYGVAFQVRQVAPTTALRVFDIAVEAQAAERSRV